MTPKIYFKTTKGNLILKMPAPKVPLKDAVMARIKEVNDRLFSRQLEEAKDLDKKFEVDPDAELKLPTQEHLIRHVHKLREDAITRACGKVLGEMSESELAHTLFYLNGIETSVAKVGPVLSGIHQRFSGDSVLLSLVAELNDIPISDAFAALTANKKVKPGARVTAELSAMDPEVASGLVKAAMAADTEAEAK